MMNPTDEHVRTVDDELADLNDGLRRLRRRLRFAVGGLVALTLAVSVAPVAANHLNVKTSDINNGAVTTPKLADNAVKEPKINDGAVSTRTIRNDAVTAPKIRNRAVGSQKIARNVPGVAVAGAYVGQFATTVNNSFNRMGGQLTVEWKGTGIYDVTVPGLADKLGIDAIVVATIAGATPGTITHGVGADNNTVRIHVFNSSGAPTDLAFNVVIVAPRAG